MSTSPRVRFLDRNTPPHIATLILLAGISALTMSVFVPSLERMKVYFDTSYGVMQLAVSGYLLATAFVQLFIGPIADKIGRRPVMLCAITVFVIASFAAIFTTSIGWFLFFRMLQAVIATCMVLSRAVVRDMVPQNEAASMIGYVTMGMALVPMVGPMIGGVLDQLFDWRATFVVLTLFGLGVGILCFYDQGETVRDGGMSFRDQLSGYPELLRSPRFWGYAAASAFASGAFFAVLGGASFIAGTVFELTPFWTGLALGIPASGYMIGNFISGRYSVRVGINRMALYGSLILTVAFGISLAIGLAGYLNASIFFGFCIFLGIGNGLVLPNVMAGTLSVRPHLAGTASGLSGAIMIAGGAGLSAASGAWMTEDSGALPLQWIMFLSVSASLLSILYVIWREKQISG